MVKGAGSSWLVEDSRERCAAAGAQGVWSMAGSRESWRPPRLCDTYWSEFRHCKSLRHRFHHYYTYGTTPMCQQWKEDYEACREWEKTQSAHAKECLQKSERSRVSEQRNFTPVWKMRDKPPSDWHTPLNQGNPEES
ncbi:hypothetical protein AMEX_G14868 [Astyanax mexicanus]|uniref:Synaptic plasticity regulator PANTS n=1 Tax=Astyanax mexicanus TaxID=7994 RepID=A0A8B9GRH6_ASTMX|nr:hypothetical protein AMEX_G14868 [Astyanax mexicanus]